MPRYFVTDDVNLVGGPFDDDAVRECADSDDAAERYADMNIGEEDTPAEVFVVDVDEPGHYEMFEIEIDDGMWTINLIDSV